MSETVTSTKVGIILWHFILIMCVYWVDVVFISYCSSLKKVEKHHCNTYTLSQPADYKLLDEKTDLANSTLAICESQPSTLSPAHSRELP